MQTTNSTEMILETWAGTLGYDRLNPCSGLPSLHGTYSSISTDAAGSTSCTGHPDMALLTKVNSIKY